MLPFPPFWLTDVAEVVASTNDQAIHDLLIEHLEDLSLEYTSDLDFAEALNQLLAKNAEARSVLFPLIKPMYRFVEKLPRPSCPPLSDSGSYALDLFVEGCSCYLCRQINTFLASPCAKTKTINATLSQQEHIQEQTEGFSISPPDRTRCRRHFHKITIKFQDMSVLLKKHVNEINSERAKLENKRLKKRELLHSLDSFYMECKDARANCNSGNDETQQEGIEPPRKTMRTE